MKIIDVITNLFRNEESCQTHRGEKDGRMEHPKELQTPEKY